MDTLHDVLPQIAAVAPHSAAERVGLTTGDRIRSVNGVTPRDVIEWHQLLENDHIELVGERGNAVFELTIERRPGEPFGAEVASAVFDRVQTCDNHCEFCFIYQLPPGMRKSLYLKDDDYRLSFLYGNFTTLTRFTEADFERVVSQKLSPLYVSIHATRPATRAEMLRNSRGGFSLRWLQELGRAGIEIRGQIVLCPGVNDGEVFEHSMLDLLDQFSFLSSVAVVPLGLSKHNTESRMRVHTAREATAMVHAVGGWQDIFHRHLGRRFVYLADEFYLLASETIPAADHYGAFEMVEDGIGIARRFMDDFESGRTQATSGTHDGFFASLSAREAAAHTNPTDYVPNPAGDTSLRRVHTAQVSLKRRASSFTKVAVITGRCAESVVRGAVDEMKSARISVHAITNDYFGGNTSVAGLLTGTDIERHLSAVNDSDTLYVLPDVCLNQGRFLDGTHIDDLRSRYNIEVVPADGGALRRFLEGFLVTK